MMANLLDIDEAAQIISVRSTRGAIILLDFKAAFPSMDHAFIWDTLAAVGVPLGFVDAIKLFYTSNTHSLRLHGALFDGPTVHCGVRRGCPLSGLLFAICADVILISLEDVLCGKDEVVRAFADDTAIVMSDYTKSVGIAGTLFLEVEAISGL